LSLANLATPPAFSPAAAAGIASTVFDIAGTAEALPSERDQNFKYTATADGQRYVLKIANSAETRAVLEAENAAMQHLAASGLTPRVQPTKAGTSIGDADGHSVRLISFLNGKPLGTLAHHRSPLLQDLGRVLGTINNQLRTFDHPAVHREFHWDLAHAEDVIERHVPLVRDAGQIHLIKMVLGTYRAQTKPLLAELRKGVIHNDANDYNVLASQDGERIAGIVDFGDMVYSHTVNDLAIAMAYMALGKSDPVAAARDIVRGYHAVNPLTEAEMAVAFNLMCMRLCVSVCLAANNKRHGRTTPILASARVRSARHCQNSPPCMRVWVNT
jgi:Ser/Thr protein kinase RdoA (MazF antagonist)